MNDELDNQLLDFKYLPLVEDIYESLDNKEKYQDVYNKIKAKLEEDKLHNTKVKVRLIKTKILIVLSIILNFLNNVFIRLCGYMIAGCVLGMIHFIIHPSSFLTLSGYGQKIYDVLLQRMFQMTSEQILIDTAIEVANPIMDTTTANIVFYTIFMTVLLFIVWLIYFIVKMIKDDAKIDGNDIPNFTLEASIRMLGVGPFDGFKFIQKQCEKQYLNNQIIRKNQLKYIKAYLTIVNNKELVIDEALDQKEKNRLIIKMICKGIIYSLNLISKSFLISGMFILIYFRFVDFFVVRGYLGDMWRLFVSIHEIFRGGIFIFMPMYQEFTIEIQTVLSVGFLIGLISFVLQVYKLSILPMIHLRNCYTRYICLTRNQEKPEKFHDNYNMPWLVLMIFILIFVGAVMLAQ